MNTGMPGGERGRLTFAVGVLGTDLYQRIRNRKQRRRR